MLSLLPPLFLISSCSSQKEVGIVVQPKAEAVEVFEDFHQRDEGYFDFFDQYYVKGSTIDMTAEMPDSAQVQSFNMIRLEKGNNETLVLYRFHDPDGKETWLGVEFPSLTPGDYDLSNAMKLKCYSFNPRKPQERFEGISAEGKLIIKERKDGHIIGNVGAKIKGVTQTTGAEIKQQFVYFNGSFEIPEFPLDSVNKYVRLFRGRL